MNRATAVADANSEVGDQAKSGMMIQKRGSLLSYTTGARETSRAAGTALLDSHAGSSQPYASVHPAPLVEVIMVPLRTVVAAAVVTGSAALAACLFPTDRSGDLQVEADAVPTLLERDTVRLAARLVDAADVPVPNAEIRFSSSDPSVLLVSDSGRAVARSDSK